MAVLPDETKLLVGEILEVKLTTFNSKLVINEPSYTIENHSNELARMFSRYQPDRTTFGSVEKGSDRQHHPSTIAQHYRPRVAEDADTMGYQALLVHDDGPGMQWWLHTLLNTHVHCVRCIIMYNVAQT